ncbi:MAG: ATP-binding protein [Sulfurimonas sp.]|jgi:hypothetical protein
MLTKIEITNFKNFNEKILFDLGETKSFEFNKECIKNKIVNKAIIYGENGSGKSNLGFAIFDIVSHLTDKKHQQHVYENYLNARNIDDVARFKFEFKFDNDIVIYEYTKINLDTLKSEKLLINGELFTSIDRNKSTIITVNAKGAETLNKDIGDSKISIISYIKNNALLEKDKNNKCFMKFLKFVNTMLFFRSLQENTYIGLEQGTHTIDSDIIKQEHIQEFESFLNEAGIKCKLGKRKIDGQDELVFNFGTKKMPFFEIASSGTMSLASFYFWFQRLKDNKASFVFIDEFDAFYHHKLSALIVKKLKDIDAQTILTTHNTSIMSTELLRPDCYYILDNNKIKSLSNSTAKELREAHNIEKIYKAGGFV